MKNCILLILILSVSLHSCNNSTKTDHSLTLEEFRALGMPDYSKEWSLEDYSNAILVISTLKYREPGALPSRESEKSGPLFRRMIDLENLIFLQDETLPLHAKAEIIQFWGSIVIDLSNAYTFLGGGKQLYIRELADIDLFGLSIVQVMLDLGSELKKSEDPEDIALLSDFPLIQQMYLDLISDLFEKQKSVTLYPKQTLELLSDSLSSSVRRNMHWFNEDASETIKQAMLTVIDSSSSRKIRSDYRELTEIL